MLKRLAGAAMLLGLASLLVTAAGPAQADFIPLTGLPDFPDIISSFINTSYDAATDDFTAAGFAVQLDDGSADPKPINNPGNGENFHITATIDDLGNLLPGGTLMIDGSINGQGLGNGNDTLLTGDLVDLGFADFGDPAAPAQDETLEFLLEITGGAAADLYGGVGAVAGVILNNSGFDNNAGGTPGTTGFAVSFGETNFGGSSNVRALPVGVVPEPGTLSLVMLGGVGLCALRRRTRTETS